MKNIRTIFLIGGHITPLIATYSALVSKEPGYRYIVVGRKYAFEGSNSVSEEYRLVRELGLPFLSLTTGRLTRALGIHTGISLLKLPIGFVQAFYYCFKYKPGVIVSFGGYLALPVVMAGWLFGVPSVTHEQTRSMGLSNRILRFFVRNVLLSYEDTAHYTQDKKTIITGLPVRKEIYHPPRYPGFSIPTGYPVVYITGGSTGSTSVNSVVFDTIPKLTEKFTIVHQTGRLDYEKGILVQKELPPEKNEKYIVSAYFSVSDISWLLHNSVMVVGRSGANTVAEIMAVGAIALFIPLPWAGSEEQKRNVEFLVRKGTAKMLSQPNLSSETLYSEICSVYDHREVMKSLARRYTVKQSEDPSTRIASEVISLMS